MFSSYQQYLSCEFSPDYWSDVGISEGSVMLGGFSDEDWASLLAGLPDQEPLWKVRCAETIDADAPAPAVDVVLSLLEDEEPEVVIAAVDALRSMPQASGQLSPTRRARLEALREQAGVASKAVLDDFLRVAAAS